MKVSFQTAVEKQQNLDTNTLRLTDCDVNSVDVISPKLSKGFTALFMSRNFVTTLTHIDQFENLRILSLSHNLIKYLDDVQPLTRLKSLIKLSLVGNFVVQMPFYKEHILTLCLNLEELDGCKVDSNDYKLATQVNSKARVTYDQLQVNQLRNCLLEHLCVLSICHVEMRKSVFGKFRFPLQSHIDPQTRAASLSADVDHSWFPTYMVLRQATQGRVFHWLLLMAAQHFRRSVQNDLLGIKLKLVQKNSSKSCSALDVECVSTLCQRQQSRQNDLLNRCSKVSHASKSSVVGIELVDGEAYQIPLLLDAVNQLHFGSHPTAMQSQVEFNPFVSVPANSVRLSSEAKTAPPNAYLVAGKDHSELLKDVTARADASVSGVVPMSASEMRSIHHLAASQIRARKVGVQEKYERLLSQMSVLDANHSSSSPTARTVLSSRLPQQQVEPSSSETRASLPNPNRNLVMDTVPPRPSSPPPPLPPVVTHYSPPPPPPPVDVLYEVSAGVALREEDYVASAESHVVANDVLLNGLVSEWVNQIGECDLCLQGSRQFAKSVSPRTRSLIDGDKEASMNVLNMEVRRLSDELKLLQRGEMPVRELSRTLSGKASALAAANLSLANSSLALLTDEKNAASSIERSTAYAVQQWLPDAADFLSDLEDQKTLLVESCARIALRREEITAIRDSIEAQSVSDAELLKSITTVCAAEETLRKQFENDLPVLALLRAQKLATVVDAHRNNSVAFYNVRQRVFLAWRRHTRQQVLVGSFHTRWFRERRVPLLRTAMTAMRRFSSMSVAEKVILKRTRRRRTFESFFLWKDGLKLRLRERECQLLLRSRSLTRALVSWRAFLEAMYRRKDRKRRSELYVSLFTLVRVFRAWRRLTASERLSASHLTAQCKLLHLSRCFQSWMMTFKTSVVQAFSRNLTVADRQNFSITKIHFSCWRNLFLFRQHLLHYKLKKRGVTRWRRYVLLGRQSRTLWQLSEDAVTHKLRKALRVFIDTLRGRRTLRVSANTISSQTVSSLQVHVWKHWLQRSEARNHFRHQMSLAVRSSNRHRSLRSCLSQWHQVTWSHRHVSETFRLDRDSVSSSASVDITSVRSQAPTPRLLRLHRKDLGGNFTVDCEQCSFASVAEISEARDVFGEVTLGDLRLDTDGFVRKVRYHQVWLRTIMRGWRQVACRSRTLRELGSKVTASICSSLTRRAFSVMHSAWVQSLSLKLSIMHASGAHLTDKTSAASLEGLEICRQNSSSLLVDGRTRWLALEERARQLEMALSETAEAVQHTTASELDVEASLETVAASIETCSAREKELRDQCRALLLQSTGGEGLAGTLMEQPLVIDGPSLTPTGVVDDRLLLMRDVNDLYSDAVNTQETALAEREKFHSMAQAAAQRISFCSQTLLVLDEMKVDWQLQRETAEAELASITQRLNESTSNTLWEASKHQEVVSELDRNLLKLSSEMKNLSILENNMRLEASRAPVSGGHNSGSKHYDLKDSVASFDPLVVLLATQLEKENVEIENRVLKGEAGILNKSTVHREKKPSSTKSSAVSSATITSAPNTTKRNTRHGSTSRVSHSAHAADTSVSEQIADVSDRIRLRLQASIL